MRFKISIEFKGHDRIILPINYQYPLSAWIYKMIHTGDNDFAYWLHEQGYIDKTRQFKLFTFSMLQLDNFKIGGDRFHIRNPEASLIISFHTHEAAEPFIKGLFTNQNGRIGDRISGADFTIKQVEKQPDITLTGKMRFRTLSPMVVSKNDENGNKALYLSPESADYEEILKNNLINKQTAWLMNQPDKGESVDFGSNPEFSFQLNSKPKARLISIKAFSSQETKVKGYMFDFTLRAPLPFLKMGYYAGFGEKNSLGFGCVGVLGK